MTRDPLLATQLTSSPEYLSARKALLDSILSKTKTITGIRGSANPEARENYLQMIKDYGKSKGREQYFNYLSSGFGRGPFVELLDGSVKLDLITGIGVNFFGHSHPEIMSAVLDTVTSDTMQGNLQPGPEAKDLIAT